jgi:hypothetical protein
MTTYSARSAISSNTTFINRVKQAALEMAVAVQNEADTVDDHAQRARLAALVVAYPDEWAKRFAAGASNSTLIGTGQNDPSLDSTAGDSALAATIVSLWSAYSAGLPV